jgi:hypothetical protein
MRGPVPGLLEAIKTSREAGSMRSRPLGALLFLLASCGDDGIGPGDEALVPRIMAVTPQTGPSAGEAGFLIDLEVRTQAGTPYPDAVVSWEANHGAVLAPALTDSQGELQALWTFNIAGDPNSGTAQLRACARRELSDACGYSEPAVVEIP